MAEKNEWENIKGLKSNNGWDKIKEKMEGNKITKFIYKASINFILITCTILLIKVLLMPVIDRSMISSALNNNLSNVRFKLDYLFADVKAVNKDGYSALYLVAKTKGDVKMTQLLLSRGADVNQVLKATDALPTSLAIREKHYEAARLMIKSGLNSTSATQALFYLASFSPHTPFEVQKEFSEKLLSLGADVNTALEFAVQSDNIKFLEILRGSGADLNHTNQNGGCLFFDVNSREMVDYLVEQGLDVNCRENSGANALFKVRNEDAVRAMLRFGADVNATTVTGRQAVQRSNKLISLFVEYGADFHIKNNQNDTLLHQNGMVGGNVCKLLVNKGLDVNARNSFGKSPIFLAIANNSDIGFTKCLIDNGADVNAQDNRGNTALHSMISDIDKVRLLLKHGAKVNIKNNEGKTALDIQLNWKYANIEIIELLKNTRQTLQRKK